MEVGYSEFRSHEFMQKSKTDAERRRLKLSTGIEIYSNRLH